MNITIRALRLVKKGIYCNIYPYSLFSSHADEHGNITFLSALFETYSDENILVLKVIFICWVYAKVFVSVPNLKK